MKHQHISLLVCALLAQISLNLSAQPVPHHFGGITIAPDRTATLSLDGSVSKMFNLAGTVSNQFMQMFDLYPIESSDDLKDWKRVATLLRANNDPKPLLFSDVNAPGLSRCFYRTPTNHLITAFPKPTGPFTVGTVDRVMIDPARTNMYRYSPPTNALMVTFWYPCDPPPAGALPSSMWDQRLAADTSFYSLYGLDSRWGVIAPKLAGHRFRGAPLAAGSGKFPVIIYSHGDNATRETSSQIAEELASHGYIVVAPDYTSCWATQFPDGRYLKGSGSGDIPGRLKDLTFLTDEIARLNSSDTLFSGRVDPERIGVSGISSGGLVVETCRSDNRVKCAALWDATNVQLNSAGLQKPFLAAAGEVNCCYSDGQWLFSKATSNAVLLQIRSADHQTGSDAAWTMELPKGRAPATAINACLVWFFDTYLKGQTPPFPTNPEIYNVQRK